MSKLTIVLDATFIIVLLGTFFTYAVVWAGLCQTMMEVVPSFFFHLCSHKLQDNEWKKIKEQNEDWKMNYEIDLFSF